MAFVSRGVAEQEAYLEKMLAEFRVAQQRRLVKQGMALWSQTEAAYLAAHIQARPPPTKTN